MAIKKSQLYASLWQSCYELRGGMDASQYKDYILTLLFMKYISDKAASPDGSLIYVPDGGGFADMVKLKGDIEIGDKVNKIIGKLADENEILAYQEQVNAIFQVWRETHEPLLLSIEVDASPRKIIQTLSENLLDRFTGLPLLDPYDVYQKLMDY